MNVWNVSAYRVGEERDSSFACLSTRNLRAAVENKSQSIRHARSDFLPSIIAKTKWGDNFAPRPHGQLIGWVVIMIYSVVGYQVGRAFLHCLSRS